MGIGEVHNLDVRASARVLCAGAGADVRAPPVIRAIRWVIPETIRGFVLVTFVLE